MKRTLLGTTLLAGLLAASAHWAGQDDQILPEANAAPSQDIRGEVGLLKLAIPAGDEVGNILRRDAQLSSGFKLIDRRSIPAELVKDPGFKRKKWNEVGAQAVIKNATVGGQLKFQLYDMAKGKKPVLVRGFPAGDKRKAVHQFMNEVIKYYTGVPGVFGSRIAFVRTRRSPTVSKNIFTMEMDGGNVAGITGNRSLNILPSLGPGGQVVFTSYAKRNPDLWMSAGGPPKRVSRFPGLNLGGVMSPTGGSIVLALSKDGNAELYKIDTSGNIQGRLTNHRAIDGSPTFSPGGNQIAFVSDRAGGPQVYRMSSGGGGATKITRAGSYNQTPDWSHGEKENGKSIAYAGRAGSRMDIFSVDASGGNAKRLTQGGGSRNLDPSWAPDGRLIAFSSSRGGITVANREGNNPIVVLKGGSTPDWGPRVY